MKIVADRKGPAGTEPDGDAGLTFAGFLISRFSAFSHTVSVKGRGADCIECAGDVTGDVEIAVSPENCHIGNVDAGRGIIGAVLISLTPANRRCRERQIVVIIPFRGAAGTGLRGENDCSILLEPDRRTLRVHVFPGVNDISGTVVSSDGEPVVRPGHGQSRIIKIDRCREVIFIARHPSLVGDFRSVGQNRDVVGGCEFFRDCSVNVIYAHGFTLLYVELSMKHSGTEHSDRAKGSSPRSDRLFLYISFLCSVLWTHYSTHNNKLLFLKSQLKRIFFMDIFILHEK